MTSGRGGCEEGNVMGWDGKNLTTPEYCHTTEQIQIWNWDSLPTYGKKKN